MTKRDPDATRAKYIERQSLLDSLAKTLETEVAAYLTGIPHIDRVYFRAKGADSFVEKALAQRDDGAWKYDHPFEEIEDQVAGRVLVFYRSDIDNVVAHACWASVLTCNSNVSGGSLSIDHVAGKRSEVRTHTICVVS